MDNQRHHDGGQGGEAESEQERRGHRRRGAEAGGSFDKGAEEPGDEDRLNAAVLGDAEKALADAFKRAAFAQGE